MCVSRWIVGCTVIWGLLASPAAQAIEGGVNAYPLGGVDFRAGFSPPPGALVSVPLATYVFASRFNGEDGVEEQIPDFSLKVWTLFVGGTYAFKQRILGGTYSVFLAVPVLYLDVVANFPAGLGLPTDGDRFGIGDIPLSPINLGWQFGDLFTRVGVGLTLPTGKYVAGTLNNAGSNCFLIWPNVSFTYILANRIDISARFQLDISTKNADNQDYQSGLFPHVESGIGYIVTPAIRVGLNAYYAQQITDDQQNGVTYQQGYRTRVAALGPAVSVDLFPFSFTFKYHREFAAENKAVLSKFGIVATIPLSMPPPPPPQAPIDSSTPSEQPPQGEPS